MTSSSSVVPLRQPDAIDDPLTTVLRSGARRLLAQAIEAEADAFLATMKRTRLPDGRDRVVRHGHGPERQVQTGIGPVAVQRVRLRDRGADGTNERIRFTAAILPRWARRTHSLDALLPILYLRGVSMGDVQEALAALLGRDAPNLSPSVIARLRSEWEADDARWQRRDLSARRYVYIWADGVYLQARMEPQAECMLVLIGATPEGKKELLGFQVGQRESAQSWRELLVDLKARGLAIAPELATGDGALGFWRALDELSPTTRHQRCTVHKSANVLDKLPKSVQSAAKSDLREIWTAPDRATAEAAIATFADKYGAKYPKAVTCLTKDRDALLTFYDFPAEHWDHLRTSNPIESVFATVRHRTVRTKGALSQDTARLMVFKLVTAAAKTWRRPKGENQLPKVVQGVTFTNGVEVNDTPAQSAARSTRHLNSSIALRDEFRSDRIPSS
jgi:putative transposase